ncbi:hypothetical protein [Engelhardtia mirabilis]|uniref:ELWxxDGT repeat protein n=1 Tax=Engelhardtia mirabilis TaxID=2528011 RepID=A0A518BDS6_9BACT|nr:hypothetical protein Pla133_02020 [Planctomycetes bacterium Pla133]QDU99464.1 hypothetical protein Pla86_02020 [Planctomycetes bacterium Pla86]
MLCPASVLLLGLAPLPLDDTLFVDLDATLIPGQNGSSPRVLAADGARVFFEAGQSPYSNLYVTDGTAAGTVQLTSQTIAITDGVLLPGGDFVFGVGFPAAELWRSDGTPAGTGALSTGLLSAPEDLVAFGGQVWFRANTPGEGYELWRSDGTAVGTQVFQTFNPGLASGVQAVFAGDAHLYLHGGDSSQGTFGLWATDGVQPATFLHAWNSVSAFDSFKKTAAVAGRVVFDVVGSAADRGWWASDGTSGGTIQLESTAITAWTASAGGKLYFAGGPTGARLRVTDGTLAGTAQVNTQTSAGGQQVTFTPGVEVGGKLAYGGVFPGAGTELCTTDGATVDLLADVVPGSAPSSPDGLTLSGGKLFFVTGADPSGQQLWSSAPDGSGAAQVSSLATGEFGEGFGDLPRLWPTATGVVFVYADFLKGEEVFTSDGLSTDVLLNIGADEIEAVSSDPRFLTRLGGHVYFAARDAVAGDELWRTDGTTEGTELVVEVNPGAGGSTPNSMVAIGDRIVFSAYRPDTGFELWSTAGDQASTELLVDIAPGPTSSYPAYFVRSGDRLYFIARSNDVQQLWYTDGTTAGTAKAFDLYSTASPTFIAPRLARLGDRLLVLADLGQGLGIEPCSTDGTLAGTQVLADISSGALSTPVPELVVAGSQAFFSVSSITVGQALYRTDGTPAGTLALTDSVVGPFQPDLLTAVGDELAFRAQGTGIFDEAWLTDGTAAGTGLLVDPASGQEAGVPQQFQVSGGVLFFTASTPSIATAELWTYEPTSGQVTQAFASTVWGSGPSLRQMWAPSDDGRVLFSFNAGDGTGIEPWTSDGTPAGTQLVADIADGFGDSEPTVGARIGSTVLFSAGEPEHGIELHAVSTADVGGWAVTEVGEGCAGISASPRLGGAGAPVLGSSFDLVVDGGEPASLALLFFGTAFAGPAPLGTCGVLVSGPTYLATVATDATGSGALPLAIPADPALIEATVWFQSLAVGIGGPFLGLGATSNALEVVVGP